jgi:type II secretory pathway component PulM
MASFPVYQNQWLYATFGGGLALILMFVLCYFALWRPRQEEREAQQQEVTGIRSFFSWLVRVFPWAIILAILGTAGYTVIHTAMAALNRPNW